MTRVPVVRRDAELVDLDRLSDGARIGLPASCGADVAGVDARSEDGQLDSILLRTIQHARELEVVGMRMVPEPRGFAVDELEEVDRPPGELGIPANTVLASEALAIRGLIPIDGFAGVPRYPIAFTSKRDRTDRDHELEPGRPLCAR